MGSPGIELLFIKQTHGVTRLHSAGLLSVADKGVVVVKEHSSMHRILKDYSLLDLTSCFAPAAAAGGAAPAAAGPAAAAFCASPGFPVLLLRRPAVSLLLPASS